MNKKFVFISSIAAPHQVKFCFAFQDYFDTEFWFYEEPSRQRAEWWNIALGEKCKILKQVFFKQVPFLGSKYICMNLIEELNRYDPDIVMLGGFSIPSNYMAYRWAKNNSKKVLVFTERSRDKKGILRKRSIIWRGLRFLYRDLDLVITSAEDAVSQFKDEFKFGDKVVAGRYAADLENYFSHRLRNKKKAYTYLFANRMTAIYNPIGAIEIFESILQKHPGSCLLMNVAGEMAGKCKAKIEELGITDAIEFLTDIKSWNDLNLVYERADIMIFPAYFSNGNFTILEAMASGMGVVISNKVLGIGMLIDDGVNGFNCAPTTDEFVERIERYIHAPDLFYTHTSINRSIVKPLSTKGTAKFFTELIQRKLDI